jgi:hypothetical protein
MDSLFSLALSMQANPGVYALLVGSGVSRAAGVPTGWEVVLDLINKLAKLENEDPGADPEAWYSAKYGHPPTYSDLLEAAAKSQAERSQLLRSYFEPTEEERQEGRKLPTKAHHSIAALFKMGMIRVVITTNFDRLLENALEAEGVNPTVIRSPDDVDGAVPLAHSQCTVIKVHGDYLDLRTRNTSLELEAYDKRVDRLLDRVFDEFGLIVCGWSAEWDRALCNAIKRTKGRRFTTYWTKITALTDVAQHLIDQRKAQLIEIEGADEFFDTLAEKIRVLADMRAPHPLSVQAAIAQTKRYLPETKYPIRLHDLLMGEIEALINETSLARYPVQGQLSKDDWVKRITDFEALSSIAASIIATGCFWGANEHHALWIRALNRLGNRGNGLGGNVMALGLQAYPVILLQYAGGIAAAAAGKLGTIYAILTQPRIHKDNTHGYFSMDLAQEVRQDFFKVMPGLERMHLALTEELYKALREPLKILIPSDLEYLEAFDTFETLQSLESAERADWALAGVFMYRYYVMRGGTPIHRREGSPLLGFKDEVSKLKENAPILKAGFLRGTVSRWENAVKMVDEMSGRFY